MDKDGYRWGQQGLKSRENQMRGKAKSADDARWGKIEPDLASKV